MKTQNYQASDLMKGILFLSIALICTILVSCNKNEKCAECPDKSMQHEVATENSQNKDTTDVVTNSNNIGDAKSNSYTSNSSSETRPGTKTSTSSNNEEEDDSNVSVINPNDKSNSDSKRTYGSSGTGGGSGTSGSGGDGNGSSGWNSYDKNKKSK